MINSRFNIWIETSGRLERMLSPAVPPRWRQRAPLSSKQKKKKRRRRRRRRADVNKPKRFSASCVGSAGDGGDQQTDSGQDLFCGLGSRGGFVLVLRHLRQQDCSGLAVGEKDRPPAGLVKAPSSGSTNAIWIRTVSPPAEEGPV